MGVTTGRRARSVQDKQQRIFAAAAELFAELGFERVTTQAVSERADIAAGTLFRYASSKAELLLMVYNEELRSALGQGERAASALDDPAEAIFAMVRPIIEASFRSPENSMAYQRELMFGPQDDRYRSEALALVARLEERVAQRLSDSLGAADDDGALLAARTIFAVTDLAIASSVTRMHPDRDPLADLRGQIGQVVTGYGLAARGGGKPHEDSSATPR